MTSITPENIMETMLEPLFENINVIQSLDASKFNKKKFHKDIFGKEFSKKMFEDVLLEMDSLYMNETNIKDSLDLISKYNSIFMQCFRPTTVRNKRTQMSRVNLKASKKKSKKKKRITKKKKNAKSKKPTLLHGGSNMTKQTYDTMIKEFKQTFQKPFDMILSYVNKNNMTGGSESSTQLNEDAYNDECIICGETMRTSDKSNAPLDYNNLIRFVHNDIDPQYKYTIPGSEVIGSGSYAEKVMGDGTLKDCSSYGKTTTGNRQTKIHYIHKQCMEDWITTKINEQIRFPPCIHCGRLFSVIGDQNKGTQKLTTDDVRIRYIVKHMEYVTDFFDNNPYPPMKLVMDTFLDPKVGLDKQYDTIDVINTRMAFENTLLSLIKQYESYLIPFVEKMKHMFIQKKSIDVDTLRGDLDKQKQLIKQIVIQASSKDKKAIYDTLMKQYDTFDLQYPHIIRLENSLGNSGIVTDIFLQEIQEIMLGIDRHENPSRSMVGRKNSILTQLAWLLNSSANYQEIRAMYFLMWCFISWLLMNKSDYNIQGILLFTLFTGIFQTAELLMNEYNFRYQNRGLYGVRNYRELPWGDWLKQEYKFNKSDPNVPLTFFYPTSIEMGLRIMAEKMNRMFRYPQ